MTTELSAAALREEHEHLRPSIQRIRDTARTIGGVRPTARVGRLAPVLSFVDDVLLPHAEEEEELLYPRIEWLLGCPGATAPMRLDHRAIREHSSALADVDLADTERLQEELYSLHALITAHFEKEEELYLPLLEREQEPALAGADA